MNADELQQRVRLHNALQWFLGLALIPVSLALWVLSFYLIRFMFSLPLNVLGFDGWKIAFWIAVVFIIALAVEGFRYGKPLFELSTYTNSLFYDNAVMQSDSGRALNWYYFGPSGAGFLVSQFFFCAPRSAAHAINALRSRLPTNESLIASAASIHQHLRQQRRWIPASNYANADAALYILHKLHLIWLDDKGAELQVRYPAGEK